MKPEQRKKKGARFERFIAHEIEASGLGKAGREANSGAGFRKGDIACNLKFLLETKNEKYVNLLPNIDQAKEQAEKGNQWPEKWALISRDPRYPEFEKVYATIDFWQFLELLKREQEPMVKEPDKDMKWKLNRLIESAKSVIKILEP